MGLDNGLVLRTQHPITLPKEIEKYIEARFNDESPIPYEYELCYWRKCWNIRHEIGRALQAQSMEDVSKYWLTITDVKNIWCALQELYSKREWERGNSIWSWCEIKPTLDRDFLILEWLIFFMRHNDEKEYMVEFYDSY